MGRVDHGYDFCSVPVISVLHERIIESFTKSPHGSASCGVGIRRRERRMWTDPDPLSVLAGTPASCARDRQLNALDYFTSDLCVVMDIT